MGTLEVNSCLLQRVIDTATHPTVDPARQAANHEFDRLLLAVAQESEPTDWTPAHRQLIHQCRRRCAHSEPEAIARSAQWTASNESLRATLLAAADHAPAWRFRDFVTALVAIATTDDERAALKTWLLESLPTADPWKTSDLIAALPSLAYTEDERRTAVAAALEAMPDGGEWIAIDLAAGVAALKPTGDERAKAQAELRAAFGRPMSPDARPHLVAALTDLASTDAERATARTELLAALPEADIWTLPHLITALHALTPDDTDHQRARSALLATLAQTPPPGAIRGLVDALVGLNPTQPERSTVRNRLLRSLGGDAEPWVVADLLHSLAMLVDTDTERLWVRHLVTVALRDADDSDVAGLAASLKALPPAEDQRAADQLAGARSRLATALRAPTQLDLEFPVAVLTSLASDDTAWAEVKAALLAALPEARPRAARSLLRALQSLELTAAERAEARAGSLAAVRDASPWEVRNLLAPLPAFTLGGAERAETKDGLIDLIAHVRADSVPELVAATYALAPTDIETTRARAALAAALPGIPPDLAPRWVLALATLQPDEGERATAMDCLLGMLHKAEPWPPDTIDAIAALTHTEKERLRTRELLLTILTTTSPGNMVPRQRQRPETHPPTGLRGPDRVRATMIGTVLRGTVRVPTPDRMDQSPATVAQVAETHA